jgi:sulfate adenylyltransferase (ADP) / ATP adenylyltransferase
MSLLLRRLGAVSSSATQSGILKSIETTTETLADGPIQVVKLALEVLTSKFVISVVANLAKKPADLSENQKKENPFLHKDPHLYVGDISDTHAISLNKFNVVKNHFLILTKTVQLQSDLLNETDFDAIVRVQREFPAVVFFNCGRESGAR